MPQLGTSNAFEVGRTYRTRSLCDHNCYFRVEVLSRTAKRMSARVDDREVRTLGIRLSPDGIEQVRPHGTFSMCPVIQADDVVGLAKE